ncbi:MAG TPA: amidohydrolase [Gammaproteobacteria bacterium]|nr:amidohydrolase [Gammaproteobacteria bacterium]
MLLGKKDLFIYILLAILFTSCSENQSCKSADVVLINSTIYTLNDSAPNAQAVAFLGDTLVFVGSNALSKEYQCNDAKVIDLKGSYVYPGFVDSHAHLKGIGHRENSLNLQGIDSLKEMLTTVEIFSNGIQPGEWVVGRGWIEKVWPEKRFPTRYELDRFSSDKPVILERADGHAVVVNSLALELAGISSESNDPHGGRIEKDKNGEPTGMLIDKATSLVEKLIPKTTKQEDKRDLKAGIDSNVSLGWTQVQIAGGTFSDIEILEEIKKEGNLLQRVYFAVSAGEPAETLLRLGPKLDPENMLTVRGIKLYADGALGSRGAALLEKYEDQDTTGLLIFTKEETLPVLEEALKKGIQIQTHAIGDKGNRITLDWYQEAFNSIVDEERKVIDPRWRIEHSQIITKEDQIRFRDMEIIASMQPSHAIGDLHFAPSRLGMQRVGNGYVWRNLIDLGVVVAGGSDAPVEIGDPRIEFYAAVARKDLDGFYDKGWHLEQAVTREEALKMFTIWPAFAAFQEDINGTIEVGKLADLTIFSKDIMKVPEEEILEAQVVMTIVNGKIVFEGKKKGT